MPTEQVPVTLVVPIQFPVTLLFTVVVCIECFMISFIFGTTARLKHFTKDFMSQFHKQHENAYPGEKPAVGGFPDTGEGRYADKLPYKDWVEFNNSQRVH